MKGKELLEDLQRDSAQLSAGRLTEVEEEEEDVLVERKDERRVAAHQQSLKDCGRMETAAEMTSNPLVRAKSTGNILDLASSLQSQLSKFGHRLDDTRERLEDTARCYELLDKVNFIPSLFFLLLFISFRFA